jgi:endoglucanase
MAPVAPAGLKATLQGKTLQVSVAKAGLVKVQVFDMMGHAIESHSENITAGSFAHSFESLPMGSYVVRVQQGSAAKTLRMQVR